MKSVSGFAENACAERGTERDVAVVGLSCRFPGAPDADAFWRLVSQARDAVREVPPERWDVARYYDPYSGRKGTSRTRWGAFLDDITRFDADYFRISPREAKSLDPQHRLLLETSVEALEHAGQPLDRLEGSRTGVYVGICVSEYALLTGDAEDYSLIDKYFGTGTALSVAAGRIAYTLNLVGPAVSVETACSSSLVALHMAVSALRNGEAEVCLAGGVNVALSPSVGIYFSQLGAVSRSPECRPFDEAADGYVRGEGCGMVALKLRSAAERDGDRILALIKGSAVNQDGRSAGLTAPNGASQEAVIRAAVRDAGIDPARVGYAEAHGTGTRLGDPIEARALGAVYGRAHGRTSGLRLGAVKANIGHLESAAGIAGFIKTVLAIAHRATPPLTHFRQANTMIDLEGLGLEAPTGAMTWPRHRGADCLAGVSSFGFSGTNAHVILAPPPARPAAPADSRSGALILPASARAPGALRELASRLAERLRSEDDGTGRPAAALCRGMALRRRHDPYRLCAVGETAEALAADLEARAAAVPTAAMPAKAGGKGLAFVFSGQGSQWAGMGAALSREPAAGARIAEVDDLVRAAEGWSLRAAMDQPDTVQVPRIVASQVSIFAVQVALTALFRAWGLRPAAVIGHSMGEIAAAEAAGALSLAEATRLCLARSRLLVSVAGPGLMLLVEIGERELAAEIAAAGLPVHIAGINGPSNCVVAGARDDVAAFATRLERRGVFCREVNTDGVAGHCPLIAHLEPELRECLGGLRPEDGDVAFYSAVSGDRVAANSLDPTYWGRNLVRPVRFAQALSRLLEAGHRSFVELSPRPLLVPALRASLQAAGTVGLAVGSLQRPDHRTPLVPEHALAALYEAGHTLDWPRIVSVDGPWSPPPPYPWQRQYHWITELRGLDESDTDSAPVEPAGEQEAAGQASVPPADDEPGLAHLIDRWDNHGLRSINMRRLAPRVLLGEDAGHAVFAALRGRTCLVWAYAGPENAFRVAVGRLRNACEARGIALCLVVEEPDAALLARPGHEVEPVGTSHRIDDLARFDPAAEGYKRLRSRLSRYPETPGRITERWAPGRDAAEDARVLALIDGWMAMKRRRVPAAEDLAAEIAAKALPAHRRVYVARDCGRIVAVMLLAAFGTGTGWLLDLEFHDDSTPPGCTERMIVDIVADLRAEGARTLSLGGSYRALAGDGEEGAATFRAQVQYKSKFRPAATTLVLVRPAGMTQAQTDALTALMAGAGANDAPSQACITRDLKRFFGEAGRQAEQPAGHPLLASEVPLAGPTRVFEGRIQADHPMADQHRVGGRAIVPAAAYLDAIVSACWPYRHGRHVVLRDVVFERPLFLADAAEAVLQTHLHLGDGTPTGCTIHARSPESSGAGTGQGWERLVTCKIGFDAPRETPEHRPVSAALRGIDPEDIYAGFRGAGIDYGPAYRGLARLAVGADGTVEAKVAPPPDELARFGTGLCLHPAVLDAAMQSLAAAGGAGTGAYMIQSAAEIRVAERLPERVQVTAETTAGDARPLAEGALRIADSDGATLLWATGLLARRARLPAGGLDALPPIATIEYRPLAGDASPGPRPSGTWVLIGGEAELRQACHDTLRGCGAQVIALPAGDVVNGAGRSVAGSPEEGKTRNLVLLPDAAGGEAFRPGQRIGDILGLIRNLAGSPDDATRIWIVTRGAFAPSQADDLSEAGLWGLGAVLRAEHPDLWGGVCDLDASLEPAQAAERLTQVFAEPRAEDAWRIMPDATLVPRLVERGLDIAAPMQVHADCSYLITGWSGGVGRALVHWLLDEGAGRLVLLARGAPDAETGDRLAAEAAARGASLVVRAGSVADASVVEATVAEATAGGMRLAGVFHAAGVLHDGVLINQNADSFADCLETKVGGAWNLHRATRGMDLDAFVLFSSSAALFGPPAQGPHAAAVAALDALAKLRRGHGLPAVSIGWGPWAGLGKAAELGHDARLSQLGFGSFEADAALTVMAHLATGSLAHALVAPMDWQRWRAMSPAIAERAIFSEIVGPKPAPAEASPGLADTARANGADGGDIEGALRAAVARTLLRSPDQIDPGRSLEGNGLDSIMIVETRERLGEALGATFPLIEFFRAPTLGDLARSLAERGGKDA